MARRPPIVLRMPRRVDYRRCGCFGHQAQDTPNKSSGKMSTVGYCCEWTHDLSFFVVTFDCRQHHEQSSTNKNGKEWRCRAGSCRHGLEAHRRSKRRRLWNQRHRTLILDILSVGRKLLDTTSIWLWQLNRYVGGDR